MKLVNLLFLAIFSLVAPLRSESNKPLDVSVKVVFDSAQEDPDLASYINTALRKLPNVTVVDEAREDTAYVLMIHGFHYGNNLYVAFVTVLSPANAKLRSMASLKLLEIKHLEFMDPVPQKISQAWDGHTAYFIDGNDWRVCNAPPEEVLKKAIGAFDTECVEPLRQIQRMSDANDAEGLVRMLDRNNARKK